MITELDKTIYTPQAKDIRATCKRYSIEITILQAIVYWMEYSMSVGPTAWKIPEDDEEIILGIRKAMRDDK